MSAGRAVPVSTAPKPLKMLPVSEGEGEVSYFSGDGEMERRRAGSDYRSV